jgi:hypothetical protein
MSNFPEMEYKSIDDAEVIELAPGETSLDLLQKIYRSVKQPISRRMRAAALALPFESPKLAVIGHIGEDRSFAERLERALTRSGMKPPSGPPKLLEYQPQSDEDG